MDDAVLARLADQAVTAIREALAATKVQRISYQGQVTAEYDDIDHSTRLSAADRVLDVIGAKASRAEVGDPRQSQGPVVVVIEAAQERPRVRVGVHDQSIVDGEVL